MRRSSSTRRPTPTAASPFGVVIAACSPAWRRPRREHGISSKLILCFLRHLDEEAAFDALRQAEPWLDRIEAVGLDLRGRPPAGEVRPGLRRRRRAGLKLVAHAGEEGPPEYVWEALDLLHVDRLDHGNRSLEDPALVERLAREG
jgi:adenosine deaminase